MKTQLRTDITIAALCEGFQYNTFEGKGLFGWGGKLTIQPEYQRNYIYEEAEDEAYAAVASRRQDVDKPYQIIVRYRVVSMDGCVMECEMID